jgi:hypothetical protein
MFIRIFSGLYLVVTGFLVVTVRFSDLPAIAMLIAMPYAILAVAGFVVSLPGKSFPVTGTIGTVLYPVLLVATAYMLSRFVEGDIGPGESMLPLFLSASLFSGSGIVLSVSAPKIPILKEWERRFAEATGIGSLGHLLIAAGHYERTATLIRELISRGVPVNADEIEALMRG